MSRHGCHAITSSGRQEPTLLNRSGEAGELFGAGPGPEARDERIGLERHADRVLGKSGRLHISLAVADILEKGYTGSMGTMPNAGANGLSAQDIANLVAYLDSLK